jgi:putative ABC transport system permease protein
MNIVTLPMRALRRKLLRTAFLTTLFAASICSVVALNYVSRAVGESLDEKLSAFGANIIVEPRAEMLNVGYGGINLSKVSFDVKHLTMEQVGQIRSIELQDHIAVVAPKLLVLLKVRDASVLVIGVDWAEELLLKASYWGDAGRAPKLPFEILAGAGTAQVLGLKAGDSVTLEGKPFTVAGVLPPSGSEDDKVLFTGIRDLQAVTGKLGQAHFVEVSALCIHCPIDEIVDQIRQKLPDVDVVTMQRVMKARMRTAQFVQSFALIVSVILLLTACSMIALSLLASVNERKHEIGLLRSLGFSRCSVFAVFCMEAIFVGLVAGIVGYCFGFGASFSVLHMVEPLAVKTLAFDFQHMLLTLAGVSVISCLSSALPAWKAARIDPSRALVVL